MYSKTARPAQKTGRIGVFQALAPVRRAGTNTDGGVKF